MEKCTDERGTGALLSDLTVVGAENMVRFIVTNVVE